LKGEYMQPGPDDDPYNNPQQPPNPPGSYPPPGSHPPPPAYGDPAAPYSAPQPPYGAPQPPYGDPAAQYGGQPGYPPPAAPNNTQGLVGMILGIVSIPTLCCFYLGLPVGIAAVIVSWMGLNKAKAGIATNRTQALAGLICGGVAILLGVIGLIVSIARGAWNLSTYSNF
jgi:hypothetical protein